MSIFPREARAIAHPTTTGLPGAVKARVEHASGASLGDVRVHYNSPEPARVEALAYTRGADIFVGPGQEQHVAHEAWHVVQQMRGQVQPTARANGVPINDDAGLEQEADQRSVPGGRSDTAKLAPETSERVGAPVVQRKLGFEIEMLALVDIGGRPLPEKIPLGTFGAQNITLTVDHNSQVEAPTPTPAVQAAVRQVPSNDGALTLGRYDLPQHQETRAVQPGPEALDARSSLLFDVLSVEGWSAAHSTLQGRIANHALDVLDQHLGDYRFSVDQWDPAGARVALQSMVAGLHTCAESIESQLVQARRSPSGTEEKPPEEPIRRLVTAAEVVARANLESTEHLSKWSHPPLSARPALDRVYRSAAPAHGAPGEWSPQHPVEQFLGRESYHSILEVVTRAYPAESPQGARDVIAAMEEATHLAVAIEQQTNAFANRVLLQNTGARMSNAADTWIGNPVVRHIQTTDASIQATFAVDLAQVPAFFLSAIPQRPNPLFGLKHQSDVESGYDWVRRANTAAGAAPLVALAILRKVGDMSAGDVQERLPNVRGLLTLMLQYLLMGKYFYAAGDALDKNLVPLLSRTDLAHMYRDQVPGDSRPLSGEKEWVAHHLSGLQGEILAQSNRDADAMLFDHPQQAKPPGKRAPLNVSCRTFVQNVFSGAEDGVTRYLDEGLFKVMSAEEVHPEGSDRANAPKAGPVFELRGMVPPDVLQSELLIPDRVPKQRWVPMARYFVALLSELHSRAGAQDVRYAPLLGGGRDLFSGLKGFSV